MTSGILVGSEMEFQRGVIPFAVIFSFTRWSNAEMIIPILEDIVTRCAAYNGNAERVAGVYLEEVLSHKHSFAVKFSEQIPHDEAFLLNLLDHLKYHHPDASLRFEGNFNLDRSIKKKPLPRRTSAKSDSKPPEVPLEKIKPSLRFMRTPEFVAEGEEFYKAVGYIDSMSKSSWIQEFYVNRMELRWPQVARVDRAIGGLISDSLTVVAQNHPKFPPWWKSIGVCLSRGNAHSIEKVCRDIIKYDGKMERHVDFDGGDRYAKIASGSMCTAADE